MTINLKGNQLIITFKYDPQIIGAMRSIAGRKFDMVKKHWIVPAENAVECIERLAPYGLTPTLEAKREYDKQKSHETIAAEIKTTPAEYTGSLPLFDFQKIGAKFLKTMPSALLADAPGLGKTIQTIAALEGVRRVLILCPASLKYSWKQEILKWSEDGARVITGNKAERSKDWLDVDLPKYVIANYELLLHDWDQIPKEWDVIVADEATRISNPGAKTTKLLKKLVALKRIALTGTPISNSPNDIFSIIDWIAPKYLGTYFNFLERYCVREPRFNRIVGYQNIPELSEKIARFTLRRTKEEVLKDLPPKTIEDVSFEISPKERKLYDAVRKIIIEEIKDLDITKHTLTLIPVKMLRLKQVADHPSLVTGKPHESSKLDALKDLLKPVVLSGEKAIVFTQFAEMAKLLFQELADYNPRMLIGEMDDQARDKSIHEFLEDTSSSIFISTEAGAYGLNLQAASYVINYDLPWSAAKYEQRLGRAHRLGQLKPVTVYNLIAKNTIDEYCYKTLKKKYFISDEILLDSERLEDVGLSEEDIKMILNL